MPKNQTLGEMIKLGDLPLEQREQIADSIRYDAEHNGEFYKEVNRQPLDANKTSMTFMRSYLPKIDKTSDRYINGLIEGVTPDAEEINEAEFSVNVKDQGWYYKYTRKAVNHAWQDVRGRCAKFLQNIFKTYHDEKIADAYLSSANVITDFSILQLKDLLRLNTILFENGAVPFEGGFYKLVVAPELGDAILVNYKDLITHTTKKEAVVIGELGELAGFRIIKSRLQAFRKNSSNNYPFIAYGKNDKGEYPVTIVSYDNMADEIILTPFGGLGNDPLKQRGAIGLFLDGHGFYVNDDSICIRGTIASSDVASVMSSSVPSHAEANDPLVFDKKGYASNKVYSGGAREIVPNYDYVKIGDLYNSGAQGATDAQNTFTLSAVKGDGTAWAFGSSNGQLKTEVVAGDCVTVSGATVTTVASKLGVATIKLSQKDNANICTFVVIEVVDKTVSNHDPIE